jgi:IclR family acetate operon transcriptional repressor
MKQNTSSRPVKPIAVAGSAPETVELSLRLLERLAGAPKALGVSDLAREFGTSKTKVFRHLQALTRHGFVRQDVLTRRYEAGIKLFVLGERLRERFDIVAAARDDMAQLRDTVGHAVTLTTVVDDQVVVLELFHGHALVDFGTRPGTVLDLHASAHGKVSLAFGPAELLDRCIERPLKAWTTQTVTSISGVKRAIAQVQKRGWACAPNEALTGVNALAAPIFDHRGEYAGAIAIVGSVQHIPATPPASLIAAVKAAAAKVSKKLGAPKS